ncbi:MAG TPA: glycosyltransferase family 4 protein [Acidisphaera sp.]|nr:glycosyltransferase family 4 protein [Acidisphaera sp.]
MRVLVWQWGRRGAGPRFAVGLAEAFNRLPGVEGLLSLSRRAEIVSAEPALRYDLLVETYDGAAGYLRRLLTAPFGVGGLARRIAALRPDVALCAMPGPLDLLPAAALRRAAVPFAVVVHDARAHPGDGLPLQMTLQRRLLRRADALVALSDHVAADVRASGLCAPGQPVLRATLPPLTYGSPPPPPGRHGLPVRLLSFGRLLPYKGLGMLAEALELIGPAPDATVRVVGLGPESPELERLRTLPGVAVENRWVPETEIPALLAWADALVLSHTEASQSGVAAMGLAAGRWIVSTRVGGIEEQLAGVASARLCEPTPAALSHALQDLIDDPPPEPEPADPRLAWDACAADLLAQLRAALLVHA